MSKTLDITSNKNLESHILEIKLDGMLDGKTKEQINDDVKDYVERMKERRYTPESIQLMLDAIIDGKTEEEARAIQNEYMDNLEHYGLIAKQPIKPCMLKEPSVLHKILHLQFL